MQDHDLHTIVKESLELVAPEYNSAHWELMKFKLEQELPPPSSGLGLWKFLGPGLLLVSVIIGYLLWQTNSYSPTLETSTDAPSKVKESLIPNKIAPKDPGLMAALLDSNDVPSIDGDDMQALIVYKQAAQRKQPILVGQQLTHPFIQSVPMEYGKFNPLDFPGGMANQISKIQLVYTLHPKNFDHQELNTQRIQKLIALYPGISSNSAIAWELVGQEIPESYGDPSAAFHGFLIHLSMVDDRGVSPISPVATVFNAPPRKVTHFTGTYLLEQSIIRQVREHIITGDSTTFKVLERNKSKWKNVVVVCDWSSSMFPYGTQVFTWLSLNQSNTAIKGYVFFNDCDSLGQQILSSETPGKMFYSRDRDYEKVLEKMVQSVRKGVDNKDLKENDLEALVFTLNQFREVDEVVLIADNVSPVRYPQIIDQIDKPVRIILCGKTLSQDQAIQKDYLELARATNGSIHTIEDDLENLNQIEEGTWIKVGDTYYKYKHGQFMPTLRNKRPKRK